MPLVTITGNLRDHGLAAMSTTARPRLWLVPNKGHVKSGYALDGLSFEAELASDGTFTVDVWSEGREERIGDN